MDQGEVLAFPASSWKSERLEKVSLRNLLLEHYDRDSVAIQRYLVLLGIDVDTAQEAVQESFLRLHEHLLASGDQANLRAWLYRVAHNLARNSQTAHHSSRTDSLPEGAAEIAAQALSAEDALLAEERVERLRQAMNLLSHVQRQALLLRTQGLKYREIADVLSVSVSTVGENIQRGLQRLKELV